MLDFVSIQDRRGRSGKIVYPEFLVKKSKDLMIKGKTFYAFWDDHIGFWNTNEYDVFERIDQMIYDKVQTMNPGDIQNVEYLKNYSSNKGNDWIRYCKSLPDNFKELNTKIVFSNTETSKKDYVTRTLDYPLIEGPTECYNRLMDVLYKPGEKEKIEWAIGAIISGDSKKIQKFIVLYGGPGTGKSTVLNIIEQLFDGYHAVFDSRALASASNAFALDSFKDNPLVAIQHDGDLSRIEDNTKLNSIISHETMRVNEKYKSPYDRRFDSFLFMGTNKPVKITDAKSGIIRRLIDVHPTGEKVSKEDYIYLTKRIKYELSGIAWKCLKLYEKLGPNYYDGYTPNLMMADTNDFYNFIEYNYDFFSDDSDGISLKAAWARYKEYCQEASVPYTMSLRVFRSEIKNYFEEFHDRYGDRRSVLTGFLREKFNYKPVNPRIEPKIESWLKFGFHESEFDDIFKDCIAQIANEDELPNYKWDNVKSRLSDIDTHKLHYVRVPENLIVIDFDLKNEKGEKDFEKNLEEASKWPQTYAELSKSESGIHLHYWFNGNIETLSRVYKPEIEVKVFTGKSSLRRKLTRCNDIPIATITSGLPLRERRSNMVTEETIKSERSLRDLVLRNVRKEIHPNTKPSIDFIYKILEDAYNSKLSYDIEDMRPAVQMLALSSTHQADYCLRLLSKMKFKSEEPRDNTEDYDKGNGEEMPIVFFDVEVFPNLFVLVWKKMGEGTNYIKWINPTSSQIEELIKYRLVGFNNRKYDNHILYARMMGYNNDQLYNLSQMIISGEKSAFFGEAYNLSYTDIYDFLSAGNKMSLKKWEIKLGIHHQELGLPWNKPVDESLWEKVADYCTNDVFATEAVWCANQPDWMAREILADLSGLTKNDTTNAHTTRIIVGNDPNPQSQYVYTDLSTIFPGYEYDQFGIPKERYLEGTKIVSGKSIYRGEDPGEGGYVYAEPGIYTNVAVLDIASMHPHSLIRLNLFGDVYTMRFKDIVDARILIKHKRYNEAKLLLDGKLRKYLDDPKDAKKLANGLKTAINSVYGLTSAKFPNKLRDPRNKDNIVAKYGALFMINLKHEVQERGFTVVHIKTDSIKIANATPEIIRFVMDYGREYGYTFEHEATYNKICLVNDAVYIAQVGEEDGEKVTPYWTATGTQFQVPYVFKTLFSKEPITFADVCETKSVSTAMYLDFNEQLSDLPFDGEGNITPDDHPSRHDYKFVGKVGSFCPVKDGYNGGILLREDGNVEGKFNAVTGTKRPGKGDSVYRWLESENAQSLGMECIDLSYYNKLVDDAVDTISKYDDFEWFVSDDISLECLNIPAGVDEELPFPMNGPEVA